MEKLTKQILIDEAILFAQIESLLNHTNLIGVTDGKAVGTYVEHKFQNYIKSKYIVDIGNSASGIDLPSSEINTDIKVTSINQPQSSCPYKSSRQKIFGLGYNLLVFVYQKSDATTTRNLNFLNVTFVNEKRTSDFTITKRLLEMINDGAEKEDIIGFFIDRNIPGDEITYNQLADEVLENGVHQGYLTISNALQWRLQYNRVINLGNRIEGVINFENN
jgi:hypothetical protein